MPEIPTLLLFSAAATVLFIVPGPAVLYILARSLGQGRRAGLVSVAGIHAASLVHITAALAGLSALVASSATTFTVIKLAGAGYLIYLGVQTVRRGEPVRTGPDVRPRSYRRIFRDGFVVNLLNPKTAVFFVAFVPQFVDPGRGSATAQLLVLGAVFVVLGTVSDSAYALAGGALGPWLGRHPIVARNQHLVTGTTYMTLGVVAAFAGPDG
ncbi:MAG: LysE family translocator [Acidimicrobiia bacterium]|nr:LysE family translocator [Acidimicrobiia bacterium]